MNLHYPYRPLIVLDAAIEAPEQLLRGVIDTAQVLQLDAQRNGVEQISEYLEQHQGIDSLHLIAHGQPGGLQLGQTGLTQHNLADWASQLRQWSTSLSSQASVVLYGCRTGAGTLGQQFLTHLQQLLGVTIAASSHVVGQGQWHFDRILGPKSSQDSAENTVMGSELVTLPFHRDTLANYPGRFDPIPNFLYATDSGVGDDSGPRVSKLYILNPDTGDLEKFENGEDSVDLAARTFALSRGADGKLFYTGIEDIGQDQNNQVSVYVFDPDNPNSEDNGKIGFFEPITIEDPSKTYSIARLGQAEDGRIHVMTNQNKVIYVLDVSATNDFAENYEIPLTEIEIPDTAGVNDQGGGDLAFDPKDPNVLFISSRGNGTDFEYRIYKITLDNHENDDPQITDIELVALAVNDKDQDLGGGGSLAFGAD
ncbi:MAG: DUF4347 domain-containing protein, partial [Phormidium sp.]